MQRPRCTCMRTKGAYTSFPRKPLDPACPFHGKGGKDPVVKWKLTGPDKSMLRLAGILAED